MYLAGKWCLLLRLRGKWKRMMERVHSCGRDMLAECPGGQCIAESWRGGGGGGGGGRFQ